MRFLNKSFFTRVFFTLVPFVVAVAGLYTSLLFVSIHTTEDYIFTEYLQGEYQEFEEQVETKRALIPPPSTSYLQGYWHNEPERPVWLNTYSVPGIYESEKSEVNSGLHILTAYIPSVGQQIYLVLDEQRFGSIDHHEKVLSSFLLAIAILVVAAGSIMALLMARMLSRPVRHLAEDVSAEWQSEKQFRGVNRTDEIGTLSRSFTSQAQRLQSAIENEKSFTRHASHEMRTPIAVIRNALAVLKLPDCSQEKRKRNLQRIQQSVDSAETILDVFLCLGKDDSVLPEEELSLRAIVNVYLENYKNIATARQINVVIQQNGNDTVSAPSSLVNVVINNLVRNALNYGEQSLDILIEHSGVTFTNPIGKKPESPHDYGYGLEIVQRISRLTGWSFNTKTSNHNFVASIQFNEPCGIHHP